MSFSIEYTRTAESELLDVSLWIELAPVAAQKWRERIVAKVNSIAADPLQFRRAKESARLPVEVRQALYGKRRSQYRILYTISGTRVVILSAVTVSAGHLTSATFHLCD